MRTDRRSAWIFMDSSVRISLPHVVSVLRRIVTPSKKVAIESPIVTVIIE
jgi:hypothetical protein